MPKVRIGSDTGVTRLKCAAHENATTTRAKGFQSKQWPAPRASAIPLSFCPSSCSCQARMPVASREGGDGRNQEVVIGGICQTRSDLGDPDSELRDSR